MITAQHVRDTLDAYLAVHPEDKDRLADLHTILDAAGDDISSRSEWRGHVTAGAILVRGDGKVLLIEHRALKRWLMPGGHCEPQDVTLAGAALRELDEETGIDPAEVTLVSEVPLHIDAHPIPANEGKGEPAHQHFDARFLFRTQQAEIVGLQVEEVTDASWQPAAFLQDRTVAARVMRATGTAGTGALS